MSEGKVKENSIRIRNIQEWLLKGELVTDICRDIMTRWSITEPAAIKMIADAFGDFTKRTNKSQKTKKAFHVQLRLSLYKKALETREYKLALQIIQDLAKLEDAYYPDDMN